MPRFPVAAGARAAQANLGGYMNRKIMTPIAAALAAALAASTGFCAFNMQEPPRPPTAAEGQPPLNLLPRPVQPAPLY